MRADVRRPNWGSDVRKTLLLRAQIQVLYFSHAFLFESCLLPNDLNKHAQRANIMPLCLDVRLTVLSRTSSFTGHSPFIIHAGDFTHILFFPQSKSVAD